MKILSITTASAGWFAVFHLEDHTVGYEPVAVWALVQDIDFGEKIVGFNQNWKGSLSFDELNNTFKSYQQINSGELKANYWS